MGKKFGVLGVLTPKCNFISTRSPKGTSFQQTASFELSYIQIGQAFWSTEGHKKNRWKVKLGIVRKVSEVIIHTDVGPAPLLLVVVH
jgi:hypothetical protein